MMSKQLNSSDWHNSRH